VYYAARLAPVIVAFLIVYRLISDADLRRGWIRFLWPVLATAFFVILPMGLYFIQHPSALNSRSAQVLIFGNPEHTAAVHDTDNPWLVLPVHAASTIGTFNFTSDLSTQYGSSRPMLDYVSAPLFIFGIAYALSKFRRERYLLFLVWLLATLIIGVIITIDAPFYPRLASIIPLPYLFSAIALDRIWAALKRTLGQSRRLLVAFPLLAIWLITTGFVNYQGYFESYVEEDAPISLATGIAHYVRGLGDEYFVFLVGPPRLYFDYGTIRFLAPEVQGVSVTDISTVRPPLDLEDRGAAFIFVPYRMRELETVQAWYPDGSLDDSYLAKMREGFSIYLVKPGNAPQDQD
jgi:hypothetical protein